MNWGLVGSLVCGVVAGIYLADAADDRNPWALIVGLIFLGLSIFGYAAATS